MSDHAFGYVTPETLPAFTDLYELTMLQGYVRREHTPRATFDLFVRRLPPDRGYLVAAGLEHALAYVESLSFSERILEFLAEEGFHPEFLDWLADFEFTGDVDAVPEGTLVFENEPFLEVTGPIAEAQLLETLLINQVSYASLVATKAARMRDVVQRFGDDQRLVDFGSRRAHGTDAGLKAARAAYIGGFDGTSNVAAGEAFDIPVYGTMAHSWVQSFPTEREAFETFVREFGEDSVLLVDTYDTVAGARTAKAVADDLGVDVRGVRLDSGDLAALSIEVDDILADGGIFVSSGMDEYAIRQFFEDGGVATGFGPGTALTTSSDAPKLEGVYKLVAVEDPPGSGRLEPSMKLSAGKVTYPGRKTVTRREADGRFVGDTVGRAEECLEGTDLLEPVVRDGEVVVDPPSLSASRARAMDQRSRLPVAHRSIRDPETYPVTISEGLDALASETRESLERRVGGGEDARP
jgi:nicotinate phosphoribosyltransferase